MEELIKKIKEDYFKSALEYFKVEAEHEKEIFKGITKLFDDEEEQFSNGQ